MMGEELSREAYAELAQMLDRCEVRLLVEYLAARLDASHSEHELRFSLSGGRLRRTRIEHGPITNGVLEFLGRPDTEKG